MKISARNQFAGQVTQVTKGAVNSDVSLKLPGGTVVSPVVTNDAVTKLQLAAGKSAIALIKASHIIRGVAS